LFNSEGVVKRAYFQKKVEYPFKVTLYLLTEISTEFINVLTIELRLGLELVTSYYA